MYYLRSIKNQKELGLALDWAFGKFPIDSFMEGDVLTFQLPNHTEKTGLIIFTALEQGWTCQVDLAMQYELEYHL